jgi:hypothetical protein
MDIGMPHRWAGGGASPLGQAAESRAVGDGGGAQVDNPNIAEDTVTTCSTCDVTDVHGASACVQHTVMCED